MDRQQKGVYYYCTLRFRPEEAELAEWLKAQPNMASYLKSLIAAEKALHETGEGIHLEVDSRTQHDKLWDDTFELVKEFQEEYGRLPTYKEQHKGVRVGRWLETRLQRDKDRPDRMEKFAGLNIQSKWEQHYQALLSFVYEHDRFPKKTETYKGYNLGLWLFRQRERMNSTEGELVLTPEQKEKLTRLGIGASDWETKLLLVQRFFEEHGRFPRYKDTYRGLNLGRWLQDQCRLLSPEKDGEKIEKLKQIGAYPYPRIGQMKKKE